MKSSELNKLELARLAERTRVRQQRMRGFWSGYLKALKHTGKLSSFIMAILLTIATIFCSVVCLIVYPLITLNLWWLLGIPVAVAVIVAEFQGIGALYRAYGWSTDGWDF